MRCTLPVPSCESSASLFHYGFHQGSILCSLLVLRIHLIRDTCSLNISHLFRMIPTHRYDLIIFNQHSVVFSVDINQKILPQSFNIDMAIRISF